MVIDTAKTAFGALMLVNLIWGFGFVVVDGAIKVMPVNIFNTFRFGLATLVLLPLGLMARRTAIGYSALLASAFGYWVQTSSQRLIEPHKIALIFALEPIFAHLAAFMILGEYLGVQGWFGARLIIGGMLFA